MQRPPTPNKPRKPSIPRIDGPIYANLSHQYFAPPNHTGCQSIIAKIQSRVAAIDAGLLRFQPSQPKT